jgi:hypothetical protein
MFNNVKLMKNAYTYKKFPPLPLPLQDRRGKSDIED